MHTARRVMLGLNGEKRLMHCAGMSLLEKVLLVCSATSKHHTPACGFKVLGICRVIDHRMFVASWANARCKGLLRCCLRLMIGPNLHKMYILDSAIICPFDSSIPK